MKCVKTVPKAFLQELASNSLLYADCPIEVKRQIWEMDSNLFKVEVVSLLKSYAKSQSTFSVCLPTAYHSGKLSSSGALGVENPRKRRQANTALRQLVSLIGDSEMLYESVLGMAKGLFIETKDICYCTFRGDLLLMFVDSGSNEVAESDPCRKFATVLDSAVHDGLIDAAKATELEKFLSKLNGLRKSSNPTVADVAMIARDPNVVGIVLASIWSRIYNYLIPNELLPRDDEVCLLLVKMLHLGLGTRAIISNKAYKEDETSINAILHHFLPVIITNLLGTQLNQPIQQLDNETFLQLFLDDPAARKIALYYGLMCCAQRDSASTLAVLDLVGELDGGSGDEIVATELWFFQALLKELTQLQMTVPMVPAIQEPITAVLKQLIESYAMHAVIHKEIQQHLLSVISNLPATLLGSHLKQLISNEVAKQPPILQNYLLLRDKLTSTVKVTKSFSFFLQWIVDVSGVATSTSVCGDIDVDMAEDL